MIALASGCLPWADGMRLDDYHDAVAFQAYGVPPADTWVDELKQARAAASLRGFA